MSLASPSTPEPAAPAPPDYAQEVRIAVVMYGGVSLAIYINGIAQELLRLVRATSAGYVVGRDKNDDTATERVYRKLSFLLADESKDLANAQANMADRDSAAPTRFVFLSVSSPRPA